MNFVGDGSASGQTWAAPRFKRRTSFATGEPMAFALKGDLVIEKKESRLGVQLAKLKLVGWRIALTAIFFFFKETIRCLD